MKIEDILKQQGEIYKNLSNNKIIQECNEAIEKPKPVKLVPYKGYKILEQEYKAITELEKILGIRPIIVYEGSYYGHNFGITMKDSSVVELLIRGRNVKEIPEQIKDFQNLQYLYLEENQISEIKNLDDLERLKTLWIIEGHITEIKGLDKLQNLQTLNLSDNLITEIKGLDNLINLKEVWLLYNPIKNMKELENLRNKGIEVRS